MVMNIWGFSSGSMKDKSHVIFPKVKLTSISLNMQLSVGWAMQQQLFWISDEEALEGCESDFETAGAYLEQGKLEALNFFAQEKKIKKRSVCSEYALECKTFESYDELTVLLDIALIPVRTNLSMAKCIFSKKKKDNLE